MSNRPRHSTPIRWTVCILAGGQSRRMGRDKSRIQINGRSLLDRVKAVATSTGWKVSTVRSDTIPNCGPLSGIYTGLRRAGTGWCVFLGCDMPLVSRETIERITARTERSATAVFTETERGLGFPLTLNASQASVVEDLLKEGKRSLFQLAAAIKHVRLPPPRRRLEELFNANTPEDLAQLRKTISAREVLPRETP